MTQKVFGLISDNGDGSASMCWFQSQEKVDEMLDEDNGHESFWAANDGDALRTVVLTFPDGLDLEKCGFSFDD